MSGPGPWLDRAPGGMSDELAARMEKIARGVAAEWGVPLGPRITSGRYSYVAPAGDDAILKVIPPEDDGAGHIAEALHFWDGDGAVRLLRHDPARRALLLERIRPGTEAAVMPEAEANAIAIAVGRKIWRKPGTPHPYRTVLDWVERWMPHDDHPLVRAARDTFASMSPRTDTLVHADFHHHNLLRRGGDWVAIDPKAIVGEPEFDVPAFLWNPLHTISTRARTERRIRAFVDAGLDGDRIRAWAVVRGVCDGFPLRPGEEETSPQLKIVRELL